TILGSGIWSWLMSRNPAGVVAPFSMLVPVVGMSAAFVFLGETVSPGELCGAGLVIIGVLGAGVKAAKGARLLAADRPAAGPAGVPAGAPAAATADRSEA